MQTIAEKVLAQHPNLDEYENPWEDAFHPAGEIHPLSEGIKLKNGDVVQIDSGFACCWIDGSMLYWSGKKWRSHRLFRIEILDTLDDEDEAEVLDKLFDRFVETKGSGCLLVDDLADFCGISFNEAVKLVRRKKRFELSFTASDRTFHEQ